MNFNKSIILYLKDDELIPSEDFIFHQGDKGITLDLNIKELSGNAFYPYYSLVELSGVTASISMDKSGVITNKSLTVQNNSITLPLTSDMTDVVGIHYVQLSLVKNGNKLNLPKCKFEVKKSIV